MIGERLHRARAAAGLSMQALAEQSGLSANAIKKYEHNLNMPASGNLLKLAKALGVRSEYFFRPATVTLGPVEYRKRAATPQKLLAKIEADVLDQAERWSELVNLWPQFPIAPFRMPACLPENIAGMDELDAMADALRAEWQLGRNPVPDLIDTLEQRGLRVIVSNVDQDGRFDGLQAVVDGQPLIVVSGSWPGDRQRLTLAHELGHLLLHGRLGEKVDEEKACHRFAAAFLLPASELRIRLGARRHHLEVQELYLLKHEFGLSMQACLYRCADLGIIDDRLRQKMFMLFSVRGWRRNEPGEALPPEETRLFPQLVYHALAEGIVTESKAAELLGIPLMKFHKARMLESVDATANQ